jgi:hypothetical protein
LISSAQSVGKINGWAALGIDTCKERKKGIDTRTEGTDIYEVWGIFGAGNIALAWDSIPSEVL